MTRPKDFRDVIAASSCIFVIGVAGDSGSGKTTFTRGIREIFGDDLVSTITLDDYHLFSREERKRRGITPLAPEANNLTGLERDIASLKSGLPVKKSVYNHETGEIEGPIAFSTKKILMLEGLHTLYSPGLRSLLDFSLFVDPEPSVKYEWKAKRDMERRGYTAGEVQEEIERRREDYDRFIAPQKACADAVIGIRHSKYGKETGIKRGVYQVTLCQAPDRIIGVGEGKLGRIAGRHTELDIDLTRLLTPGDRNFLMEYRVLESTNRTIGAITFDGELDHGSVRRLEAAIERQTGIPIEIFGNRPAVTPGDLVELILAWRIINRRILIGTNFCDMDSKK